VCVALTLTHGGGFGAQVAVPGLGLLLGHGMSRFDPRPGRPNSVGPGKRPLHNMCPTVVTRDGRSVLALGATGGRRIPNTVFDVLLARLGEGRSLEEAVKAPRMHTEGGKEVTLEPAWPAVEGQRLKEVGYTVRSGPGAVLNAIERDPATGMLWHAAR
jgi:gamma-glutamyltranspeptidase/glutathione hydrolase